MRIYDTSYGPDTFGRIRMGFIQEMFLSYSGFNRPQPGDQLRISCTFKGVTRDVLCVRIVSAFDSYDEKETVLIKVLLMNGSEQTNSCDEKPYTDYLTEHNARTLRH